MLLFSSPWPILHYITILYYTIYYTILHLYCNPEGKLYITLIFTNSPQVSSQSSWVSCVWLFVTPWTAAPQASLSITNSRILLRLISIELMMPSNHLVLCHPLLLLPSINVSSLIPTLLFPWWFLFGFLKLYGYFTGASNTRAPEI